MRATSRNPFSVTLFISQSGAEVACLAHTQEVVGAIPISGTSGISRLSLILFPFCFLERPRIYSAVFY